ncbi:MAG: fibronectin type III domain-containing protein [Vulcanimicrobiaceae bacterium]
MRRYLFALSLFAFLLTPTSLFAAQTLAPAKITVLAGRGPQGVVVRWIPSDPSIAQTATLVRIAANGARSAPITVQAPTTYAAAVAAGAHLPTEAMMFTSWSSQLRSQKLFGLAIVGSLDDALAFGDAYIDRAAPRTGTFRYEVRLSDGTSATSPPLIAATAASALHIAEATATGGNLNNMIHVKTTSPLVSIERATGGAFTRVASMLVIGGTTTYTDTSAPIGIRTAYRVRATDMFGNLGPVSGMLYATARDRTALPAPTNLRANATSAGISLSWTAQRDSRLAGYEVLRGTSTHDLKPLRRLSASQTSYFDAAPPGSTFHYDVRSVSRFGIVGAQGGQTVVTRPKTTPPDAPSGLKVTRRHDAIALSWNANHDPTTDVYEVYRRIATSAPLLLAQIPRNAARSFVDRLPKDSIATYEYGVGAQDRFGNRSLPAHWLAARTLRDTLPTVFPPLAARLAPDGAVTIFLSPRNDPDIAAMRILRASDGGTSTTLAQIHPDVTHYRDVHVMAGHRYAYALELVYASNRTSAASSTVQINVPGTARIAPQPAVRLLENGTIAELHWPVTDGLLGYNIVRRDPNGHTTIVARNYRAFVFRDSLLQLRPGAYGYALQEITTTGVTAIGAFRTVEVQ